MKINFQVLDIDYILNENKPVVRLFGRTEDNKTITVFYEKFLPYFYILPKEDHKDDIKNILKQKFKDLILKIEEDEKILPIGYHKTPTKLLKITLNDPSKTPLIRDSLKNEQSIKEIFEADILFKYRFAIDNKIFGMRWYSAYGDWVNTTIVKTERKIKAEKLEEISKEENVKFKHLSLDIEIISSEGGLPDAEKDPIILISFNFYPEYNGKKTLVLSAKKVNSCGSDILSFSNEKEMLEKFLKIIDDYDPDIILGYNINNFDLPYIETRLRKNNLPRTIGRCKQKSINSRKFANKSRTNVTGRIVVDVYDLIKEATIKFGLFKGLKRYGLGDVSRLVLGEDKIDIVHSEMKSHWNDNGSRLKKLLDYSRKDAELPMKILLKEHMLDKFFELSKVSGVLLQDAIDGGESMRIENLLLREFNKKNFVMPCKPAPEEISRRNLKRRTEGLKGAFVLSPDVGFHNKCVVYLDFLSMYPSIIRSFNICPTTLIPSGDIEKEYLETPNGSKFIQPKIREGIVPQIVKYLLETRTKIKNEMEKEKDPERKRYLYAKQYAFKTVANAFYGHLGYIRAKLYVVDIANAITGTGRNIIQRTKEIVETKSNYKVIYADTDSVMVGLKTDDVKEAFKIGKDLVNLINEGIHHILDMKIESVFKTLLILSKKRYACWNFESIEDSQGSIVTKGIETVRRDWCDLVSETLQEVIPTILKEQDVKKAIKTVRDKVEKIKTGEMGLEKLVITKSVSKTLKSYKGIQPHVELVKKMKERDPASAPGVGDRVSFVIIKGSEMISKRTEDPTYAEKHNLKPDPKYYIESQLLPPLERVFEALGVNRSDLMGEGKQMGLFDSVKFNNKEEKLFVEYLTEIDGFICTKCDKSFKCVPLTGKCNFCNGEIVFFKGDKRSRTYMPSNQLFA
jgi:DNA polymerase I